MHSGLQKLRLVPKPTWEENVKAKRKKERKFQAHNSFPLIQKHEVDKPNVTTPLATPATYLLQ